MSLIQFESSRVKEEERQALRESRQKILANAKDAYERKQARAERAKERGDDRWMLPSVEAKISNESSKKKKKDKKVKKSKKKKRKHKDSDSSCESSGEEKEEWVEKGADSMEKTKSSNAVNSEPEKPLERDEWMSLPGTFLCSSREEREKKKRNDDKTRDTCILDKPGQSTRELNPYWKEGGTGLPESEDCIKNREKLMDPAWLKKSLRRAQEQAEEEGKSLEEIATERWGSLDIIQKMIEEAEKSTRKIYGRERNWRRDGGNFSESRKKYRNEDDGKNDERGERKNRDNYRNRDEERKNHRNDRSRSRSRESTSRKSSKFHDDGKYSGERKKMAFMRPNDGDQFSSTKSQKSSTSIKRWQKPEVKDSNNEKKDTRGSRNSRQRSENSSSDQSDSDREEKTNIEVDEIVEDKEEIMSEAEMNRLGAKIIKAEIMGDNELAAKLKKKLESARETRKKKPSISSEKKIADEENVILTKYTAKGMAKPLEPKSLYEEPAGGRRKAKKVETHESGKRVRYFADDDKFTLQEMFQQEKGETSAENDAAFVKMASKSMDMDELFEQRITRKESDAKNDAKERARAIKEHKKMEKSLDNCQSCFDSKNLLKHLIVALGSKIYVSLPSHASLTIGHCILAPIHHVSCQTQLDEDVWEELQNFKKALTKMFMEKNEFPVFFEISIGQRRFPHMQLECIPLPDEVGSMAPIYFKKALLECETEWSTNKKVVDLSEKDVRQAIPKGLPYFAVNFGNHGGFAHVIEDENAFPRNFAQEIIGGILDLEHGLWRKPKRENFDQQRKKVLAFAASWKSYDFTTKNDA